MTDLVLVIGSGGREHALAWKLSQSGKIKHVYVAPGNAGTTQGKMSNLDINVKNHAVISDWCKKENISLVVVGPEDPLANGLADHLNSVGIKCFGPCQRAAEIEASKKFAKDFMDKYSIPTARWKSFQSADEAKAHISSASYEALVVKASGLAAGKGVIVGKDRADAIKAVNSLKEEKSLSSASETIVIEELLSGEEVSVLCFTDGTHISVMPPAQDHKRLLENDEGPNTGGMGAYCKCPLVSSDDMKFIVENVLQRAVDGMVAEKSPYVGVLYAGLMMTKDGVKVLEFNCRFGDPETQVIVPLLKTDLYDVMLACVDGTLDKINLEWNSDKHAVGVVVVSGGYPGSYGKGKVIKNIDKVERLNHIVFHAGTTNKDGSVVTSGGRVLAVVALENSLQKAADEARLGASLIQFDGSFFRQDIAKKGVQKLQPSGLTYKSAGVDIDSADDLVGKISALTKQTRRPELRSGIGGFAGIFELSNFDDPFLVSKVGTIGEKLQAAQDCGKFEVAGHDLVANSVNDILSCGAEPLFFLDTFTCGKLNVDIAAQVITGIAKACKLANCSLIGGETAEMPGMYDDTDFDLTGFARGAVERSQLLPQKTTISSGDIAIGLLSSTVNSNGFKMVKKVMDRLGYSYKTPAPFGKKLSFEDILLQPRNIYVNSVLPLLKKGVVKAAAYMSDQGLSEKVQKVLPDGFKLVLNAEELKIPPMYHWLHKQANLSSSDMLSYFNFGIDMILVVEKTKAEEVFEHLKSKAVAASIGAVQKREKGENVVDIVNAQISCIPKPKKRVAVLSSNKGTCGDALIEYTLNPSNLSNAEIALLVVTSETGSNLAKAKEAKIPIKMVNSTQDSSLLDMLKSNEIEIICLDSFTLKLSRDILKVWNGRILNSHPSLLPAFECENVHQEVINFGARITGCTVYLEEGEHLSGKILEQTALNVEVGESAETLREKLKNLQNLIYIKALESVVSGTSHESCIHSESSQIYLRNLEKKIHTIMETTARPGFERVQDSPCDIFDLKKSSYILPYLLSGTDGVGTKLKIAMALNKHDTIGIDLVAMCVNDILTHGAEPLFFLECFSTGKVNEKTVLSVVSGIAEGCKQANCALIGTDINEMPDIYMNPKKPLQEFNTYDVVGYAEGAMQKEHLLPRLSDIKADDVVIGLASSGVHSNGYSLVRKLMQVKNFRYQDPFPLDETKTIGEVLLTPTKIYVQSMMPLIKKGLVKAAAHITGGGLTQNIPRVLPPHVKVVLDGTKWQMPPVLRWIAMEAQMSEDEILKTFNCGLGMVLVVDQQSEAEALGLLKSKGETAATIGRIQPLVGGGEQVQVENFKVPLPERKKTSKRVGVLISGSGTNLQSLIDYSQNPSNCSNAEIVLVISNVAGVEGLKRAERANISTKVLSHKDFKTRVDFDMAVHALLQESKVNIVCLAGFMRIVSKEFVQLWQGKLLNVHPAILPAFRGMNAHKLVLERGAKISGCTVHFVEAEVDAGAVIEQAAVRVDPNDDEKSLQEKVKVMEHKIFPTALELLASGRVSRGSNGKLVWN